MRELLPEDVVYSRRYGHNGHNGRDTYVVIDILERRSAPVWDLETLRFEARVVGGRLLVQRVLRGDRVSGVPAIFELSDPGCFDKVLSKIAEWVVPL